LLEKRPNVDRVSSGACPVIRQRSAAMGQDGTWSGDGARWDAAGRGGDMEGRPHHNNFSGNLICVVLLGINAQMVFAVEHFTSARPIETGWAHRITLKAIAFSL